MSTIADVTDQGFDDEVLRSAMPVVVDFWAPWCGPCRVMDPLLDELAGEHGERLRFVKVNVDENQDVAARYDILSIPTLLVFEGGEVRRKLIGAVARRRLEEELAAWLGATA